MNGGYPYMSVKYQQEIHRTIAVSKDLKQWMSLKGKHENDIAVLYLGANVTDFSLKGSFFLIFYLFFDYFYYFYFLLFIILFYYFIIVIVVLKYFFNLFCNFKKFSFESVTNNLFLLIFFLLIFFY